ncbi:hypothetical protein [Amycolatopsis panacis]|uniref:Uncharacterized protein n=1 Tax=Amycolatopsis panacis TaxID=2340917 RepID=A0A419I4T1_9PSEU|nr:hypothetical protein [Amycolatopsis panacis]RJQ85477.1 hypothetical protein D5S19_13910 [Amycolatopsis panacis]
MRAMLIQAGERLLADCPPGWVADLLAEACPGQWKPPDGRADIELSVTRNQAPFRHVGAEPLTRGAYRRDRTVVLINACGSGFDLAMEAAEDQLRVAARWRPPSRERLAARVLRSRFHLLARAALVQYPALWWAGRRGRVPLHAAAVTVGDAVPLLAGPGGIGRSTLLLDAVAAGERACSDNLCVSDGERVYGLVEPVRVEGGGGRRMAYGRRERELPGQLAALRPDRLVVLSRGSAGEAALRPASAATAAETLTAGTYMAGELRRYWAFAATLAMGTGIGRAHPAIREVAGALATRLPAWEIVLGATPGPGLAELLMTGPSVVTP